MKTAKQLMELRAQAELNARQLHELAITEKRELSPDEAKKFDDFLAEVKNLDTQIARAKEAEELVKRAAGSGNPGADR